MIHLLYVGEGGDVAATDFVEELMDLANGKPVIVRKPVVKDMDRIDDDVFYGVFECDRDDEEAMEDVEVEEVLDLYIAVEVES